MTPYPSFNPRPRMIPLPRGGVRDDGYGCGQIRRRANASTLGSSPFRRNEQVLEVCGRISVSPLVLILVSISRSFL